MKVLRVIASMDPSTGGPCQGIRNSVPEMEKWGVYNEVVCLDDPDATFIRENAFPIQALGPCKRPWCYSPKLIPWLVENLERFDAIVVHGLWLYHGYAVRKALQLLKKQGAGKSNKLKLFVMPHGMLDPYFQQTSGRRLKAVRNWFYWKLIEHKLVNAAQGLLFTCEEELKLARIPFKPYEPRREVNVGYGIAEPPVFKPRMQELLLQKCPQLSEQSYILFLGRIHEKKGLELLINAYAAVLSKRPVAAFALTEAGSSGSEFAELALQPQDFPKLLIAGPGLETKYGQRIQQTVQEDPVLSASVFFSGMLTADAKWGAYYGCEAFVLPSHQENFGIAVVEALACGKPVLISNQVNIWHEIHHSACGFVANDTQQGVEELLQSWGNLSKEEKLLKGLYARQAYVANFAIGPAAKRLMESLR